MAESQEVIRLRQDVEKLMADPEFANMSNTFKRALAQRLGLTEQPQGADLVAPLPVSLHELLKGQDLTRLVKVQGQDMLGRPYYNIYRYHFW